MNLIVPQVLREIERESSEFMLAERKGKPTRLHPRIWIVSKVISPPTHTCTGSLTSDSDARARRWPASSFCAAAASDAGAGVSDEGSARIGRGGGQSKVRPDLKGCRLQTRDAK